LTWKVEWDDRARRELRKLDPQAQREILSYLRQRIAVDADPRRFGKPLTGEKVGLWRYRIRDFRVICRIEDDRVVVLILRVAHRKEAYR
jgi:mRNA interferase RelE/StbE